MEPYRRQRKVTNVYGIWASKFRVQIKIHPRVTLHISNSKLRQQCQRNPPTPVPLPQWYFNERLREATLSTGVAMKGNDISSWQGISSYWNYLLFSWDGMAGMDGRGVGVRDPVEANLSFSSMRRSNRFLGSPSLLPNTYVGISLRVKRPGREVDHSPPASAEVQNTWIYTSAPPYIITQCLFSYVQGQLYLFLLPTGVLSYSRNRPCRPIGLWHVEVPTLSWQSARSWR
jgi:hypothetical protein